MSKYLTIEEVCSLIRFSRQSVYNLIHRGALVYQKHYFRPSRKKLLFSRTEMVNWVEGRSTATSPDTIAKVIDSSAPKAKPQAVTGKGNRIII